MFEGAYLFVAFLFGKICVLDYLTILVDLLDRGDEGGPFADVAARNLIGLEEMV